MEKIIFKSTAFSVLVVSIMLSTMFLSQAYSPPEHNFVIRADDISVPPGCGVVNIYVVALAATPGSTNFSDGVAGNVYACLDSTLTGDPAWDGEVLTGDIPYDTDFQIVVECSFNGTVGYNSTDTSWDLGYVYAEITSSGGLIPALSTTTMEEAWISPSGSSRATCNFWVDNSNSGWSVGHGETVTISTLTIKGFW